VSDPLASFGPNEWLVEELYESYLLDPNSVDKAWWDFFADFKPGQVNSAPRAGAHPRPSLPAPVPAVVPSTPPALPVEESVDGEVTILRGVAGRVVTNMDASLTIPTATSVRAVPAKLLIDNRIVINNHLRRSRGGKVSFTHIIGYALIKALRSMPEMNTHFMVQDGKPALAHPNSINLGIAIDLAKSDGTRQLLVPAIKNCNDVDFAGFWIAYEDVVRKARSGALAVIDFAGTTITLTNPGTIGTNHSVPRLMQGQGTIIGVGAMEYPAEFQGASEETLAQLAVSKVFTLTSTYDHRIIQGAQSGAFLGLVHHLLLGEDGFYDELFESLRIPYEPIRWMQDVQAAKDNDISKTARVQELIHAFRVRGHLMADTNPLEFKQRSHPDLELSSHSLTLWDLDREVATGGFAGKSFMKLRDILGVLRDSYCRTLGIEYMHIQEPDERRWIQDRVEIPSPHVARDEQLRILRRLNAAEAFEHFLQTKYVGQKRFSLEGSESVIPILDALLSKAADAGLDETCIGMPHRGRLNVLANIAGKSYEQIFREFEGNQDPASVQGSGDVKYHLGTSGTFTSPTGSNTSVYIAANPSHLEAVNPVLEGIVRAKQDRLDQGETGFNVLPILLHGDAAFAGQGVVAETLNLSQLRGYRTGGTIHVIINNQVGFTTAPAASRSSVYSTDVARMVQAPIFHVNGDDPEACVRVAHLAFEYRQTFHKDVVIDMVCYRRRGHNEADEPSFTQPLMYKLIDAKRSVRKLYTEALVGRGDISLEEAAAALKDYQNQLEGVFEATHDVPPPHAGEVTTHTVPNAEPFNADTSISQELLNRIAATQIAVPEGFTVHPKLFPQLERRAKSISEGGIDWATGEALALGSLLADGQTIRLTGQDSRRGTFGQRHCVLIDHENGSEWTPLASISPDQGRFLVYDSLLSEFAAMGFEYGYSVEREDALVIWEAQFGDFADGAQTIIDEFISSSFQKWGQRSSLVLLLPHGYEGQGPDHSSARIERFLTLCGEDNLTIAQPSTAASYFHLLRAHAKNSDRRPLVVFTPKSMLRLKAAASSATDFTSGKFQPIIDDAQAKSRGSGIQRLALCSGKLYYELLAAREVKAATDIALVRIEQFYPMPIDELNAVLGNYPNAEILWAQDEPANQGPWPFIGLQVREALGRDIRRISRDSSASPATGNHQRHEEEQAELIAEVFKN
jgi:2-oxoglutarate decarboxylase